jgi:pimeloyl-ACP methyl ester carboxylesterase
MPQFSGSSASIFYEQTGTGPDIVCVGGGGTRGRDWQRFQTPYFDGRFRSTVFDNRGIGRTTCNMPLPWSVSDFASDFAGLVRGVCNGPVSFIGSSLARPSSSRSPSIIPHWCGRRSSWAAAPGAPAGWDCQEAEIEFRRRGGSLDGMMGVSHHAAMLYPARALGDRELWPKLKTLMLEWMDGGERGFAGFAVGRVAPLRPTRPTAHDQGTDACRFVCEDIPAPPQDGEELAALMPSAEFHLLEGMGHGSWYGHAHERLNTYLGALLRRYL